jgi:hypothetical protein
MDVSSFAIAADAVGQTAAVAATEANRLAGPADATFCAEIAAESGGARGTMVIMEKRRK